MKTLLKALLRFGYPAESLVPDTTRSSIMVCDLMLACWTWSGLSLAVALCVSVALGIPVPLRVSIALCVAISTSVRPGRALWPRLSLRPG
jgi:hypothetical protein